MVLQRSPPRATRLSREARSLPMDVKSDHNGFAKPLSATEERLDAVAKCNAKRCAPPITRCLRSLMYSRTQHRARPTRTALTSHLEGTCSHLSPTHDLAVHLWPWCDMQRNMNNDNLISISFSVLHSILFSHELAALLIISSVRPDLCNTCGRAMFDDLPKL